MSLATSVLKHGLDALFVPHIEWHTGPNLAVRAVFQPDIEGFDHLPLMPRVFSKRRCTWHPSSAWCPGGSQGYDEIDIVFTPRRAALLAIFPRVMPDDDRNAPVAQADEPGIDGLPVLLFGLIEAWKETTDIVEDKHLDVVVASMASSARRSWLLVSVRSRPERS